MDDLVFRRRRASLGPLVLIMLFPLALLLAAWLMLGSEGQTLSEMLREMFAEDPATPIAFVLSVIGLIASLPVTRRYERDARLRLDANGIAYQAGLNGWPGRHLERDWPLAWEDIDRAVLHGGPQRREALLWLFGKDGRRRQIRVNHWLAPGRREENIPLQWRVLSLDDLRQLLNSDPLLRRIEQAGVTVSVSLTPPRVGLGDGSDLTKVPESAFVLGLMVGLGLYGLMDSGVIAPWGYAGPVPWLWLMAAGLLLGLLVYPWLARSRLRKVEAAGVAILLAGTASVAAYPGALRLNALTDESGPIRVEYQLENGGRLVPVGNGEAPEMIAPIDRDYWAVQSIGERWEFELSRGALGFWQYRRSPIVELVREYHESRR